MKRSKMIFFGVLIIIVFFLISVASALNVRGRNVPNPAAMKCINDGGTYYLISDATGMWGYCITSSGCKCMEWDYYFGRCCQSRGRTTTTLKTIHQPIGTIY